MNVGESEEGCAQNCKRKRNRRVAITEVSALGVRNEKILLSACYQYLTESLLQSFAKLGNAKNKDTTFALSVDGQQTTDNRQQTTDEEKPARKAIIDILYRPNSSKN